VFMSNFMVEVVHVGLHGSGELLVERPISNRNRSTTDPVIKTIQSPASEDSVIWSLPNREIKLIPGEF